MTTMQPTLAAGDQRAARAALAIARTYTQRLLDPLDARDLVRQFTSLQSPLIWDYAHIGHYEELWLVRRTGGAASDTRFDDVYDAFAHPRSERMALDLLAPAEARAFLEDVRTRSLAALGRLGSVGDPRLAKGCFVVGLVVQHELQHNETMCHTIQASAIRYGPALTARRPVEVPTGDMLVPASRVRVGSDNPWAYDNERPPHKVELPAFRIDRAPVTNGSYMTYMAETGAEPPLYWEQGAGGAWWRRRFGHLEPVPVDEPVQHVSWFEATSYARYHDVRLPSEIEWERAARAMPAPERPNLGRARLGPAPGASAFIGDVWEWTSSEFNGFPGFQSFPYPEYSEAFFNSGYRVLRGGSWATHPLVARPTFRNWDLPERRHIFAGFRCASDA